jgi:AbrB family looped-hinge helix DNA binding protein
MAIAKSKLTAQGQISVPAEIRQRLGVGPGSVLEWDEQDDQVIVRRASRYTSEEVHRALFPDGVARRQPVDVKDAIRKYVRKKHARR